MPCPDLETLAAFVDGGLDDEHAAVEAHLLGCTDCRMLVASVPGLIRDTRVLETQDAVTRQAPATRSGWWAAAGVVAAATSLILPLAVIRWRQDQPESGVPVSRVLPVRRLRRKRPASA